MPKKAIYKARIDRLEILDKDGKVDGKLKPDLKEAELLNIYTMMLRMRRFDEKALKLQRQGRIGTYGSLRGQEAAQAGIAAVLEDDDWIVPSFREHGVLMNRGMPMHLIYAYWKGDERGNEVPENLKFLPASVPVGSQLQHAMGIGLALRLKGEPHAAVGFAGDGATSEGDFHEACNFAGVFKAHTVFFIQNNQWAISVPLKRQTVAETIAQKALAYGIKGLQFDGNDVLAAYVASKEAVESARNGEPYLLEAVTFRMGDHTTADDHTRYRPAEMVEYWEARDPIVRMNTYLQKEGILDDDENEKLQKKVSDEVDEEVKRLEEMPAPEPVGFFDYMYEKLPPSLQEQRRRFEGGNRS